MQAPTRASRLPEFRLSEISREGVADRIAALRATDLSKIERPNIEMPTIDLPKIDFPHIDVAKAVVDTATSAGLIRRRRRRLPYLLGGAAVVVAIGQVVMHWSAIRERLIQGGRWARERMAEMRSDQEDIEPVAFTAAPTAPIDRGLFEEGDAHASSDDYPEGLGADAPANGVPVFKDVDSPVRR